MKAFHTCIAAVGLLASSAQAAELAGRWATPRDGIMVEISSCGGDSICGRLVTSDELRSNANARDRRNRSAYLRSRPLKDLPILWGFRRAGRDWVDGQIYNVADGKTYRASIDRISEDMLKVKGCIPSMLGVNLCGIQQWKRVD